MCKFPLYNLSDVSYEEEYINFNWYKKPSDKFVFQTLPSKSAAVSGTPNSLLRETIISAVGKRSLRVAFLKMS